jgi:hypothetical protein
MSSLDFGGSSLESTVHQHIDGIIGAAADLQIEIIRASKSRQGYNPKPKSDSLYADDMIIAVALDILATTCLVAATANQQVPSRPLHLGRAFAVLTPKVMRMKSATAPRPLTDDNDQGADVTLESKVYRLCQLMEQQMLSGDADPSRSLPLLYVTLHSVDSTKRA